MRELRYAVDIIVGTIHRGEWAWFVSEKDIWFLDQEKLQRAFERKGHLVARDSPRVKGAQLADARSISAFLEDVRSNRVTVDELRALLKAKLPAAQWDDIAEFVPSLYVDFDSRILLSLYNEPASFEDYVPDGWEGRYDDFLHLIPGPQRYWVVNGVDIFASLSS